MILNIYMINNILYCCTVHCHCAPHRTHTVSCILNQLQYHIIYHTYTSLPCPYFSTFHSTIHTVHY